MSKVKAIIISDTHVEEWKKHNEGGRRLNNSLDVWRRVKKLSMVHKAPVLFAGDLYHKDAGVTNSLLGKTLPFWRKLWSSGKFKTYAITGNHDQSGQNLPGNESPSYIKTLASTFKGLECIDFKKVDLGDWAICGVPYLTHDAGLIETINGFELKTGQYNVLMLHTTMPGAKDTDNRVIDSNLVRDDFDRAVARFDLVLCGHIHKPHSYQIVKTDIIQVGAPQQQRLTDKDCDMGYWLLYQNLTFEFFPMKYPKFIELSKGEIPKDNYNFYVYKKGENNKKGESFQDSGEFSINLKKRALAKNYIKEKGIKSKVKRRALIEALNKTRA